MPGPCRSTSMREARVEVADLRAGDHERMAVRERSPDTSSALLACAGAVAASWPAPAYSWSAVKLPLSRTTLPVVLCGGGWKAMLPGNAHGRLGVVRLAQVVEHARPLVGAELRLCSAENMRARASSPPPSPDELALERVERVDVVARPRASRRCWCGGSSALMPAIHWSMSCRTARPLAPAASEHLGLLGRPRLLGLRARLERLEARRSGRARRGPGASTAATREL